MAVNGDSISGNENEVQDIDQRAKEQKRLVARRAIAKKGSLCVKWNAVEESPLPRRG
ncbi:MAG: hypothetical protein Q9195_002848 [Heterodermia aff. obscurata]